jgi:hypothetical protein
VRRRLLLGAVVLAGAVAGSAAGAGSPLQGTYSTKLSGTSVSLLNATWNVQFKGDGHYVIYRAGKAVVAGDSSAVGSGQVKLTDASGPAACPGTSAAGSYAWSFAKRSGHTYLLFRATRDVCAGRKAVLTTHSLLKLK